MNNETRIHLINIKGIDFKVDIDDKDKVEKIVWTVRDGRAFVNIKRGLKYITIGMARIVLGLTYEDYGHVDHINHDVTDNRKSNLRFCSARENNRNRRKLIMGTSKFKGVTFKKNMNKWQAICCANYGYIYLGVWDSEYKAAYAYNIAAKYMHKKFAYYNQDIILTEEEKKEVEAFVLRKIKRRGISIETIE